jgi:hypothetical protein
LYKEVAVEWFFKSRSLLCFTHTARFEKSASVQLNSAYPEITSSGRCSMSVLALTSLKRCPPIVIVRDTFVRLDLADPRIDFLWLLQTSKPAIVSCRTAAACQFDSRDPDKIAPWLFAALIARGDQESNERQLTADIFFAQKTKRQTAM